MTDAAAHDEEMENLMRTEGFMQLIEYRELSRVDDPADGVDDPACQQPAESCR